MADSDHVTKLHFRILATSDLHAHVMAWDYEAHRAAPSRGLARLSSLVRAARLEEKNCLLLDNGDFLNGSSLSDFALKHIENDVVHPMIRAMNNMKYDAVCVGNHEFTNGVPFLRRAMKDADFPLICSNFTFHDMPFIRPYGLLRREVVDTDGKKHMLQIGIMGLLPPLTLVWEAPNLRNAAEARHPVECATEMVEHLRGAGADIIIALAHSGLGDRQNAGSGEDSAYVISGIAGIDAVIAGHSHDVFPSQSNENAALVLPGHFGSHLGIIDLVLVRELEKWRVISRQSQTRALAQRAAETGHLEPLVQDDPAIVDLVKKDHISLMVEAEKEIGSVPVRLNSFFSFVTDCTALRYIADVQAKAMAEALSETEWRGEPILAAVAPFKAGGRGGAENYTDIAAGPVRLHQLSDLYMHHNRLTGFIVTGQDVALWVNRSASIYNQILPNAVDVPLIDGNFPSFNFDQVFGIEYDVDLAQPPMFNLRGAAINPGSERIRNLRYKGAPVLPQDKFIMASNSYRCEGQAGFSGTDRANVVIESHLKVRDLLFEHISRNSALSSHDSNRWRFAAVKGASAIFDTGPVAEQVLDEVAHLRISKLGRQPTGFDRYRLLL